MSERVLAAFTEKDFEKIDITDDFLFYSILSRNMELCRELLQIILNQKILKVKLVQAQKSIKHSYDGKGVRLDVYVDDDKKTVYDIEMQATDSKNLPKRSRYYQGMIDLNLIKKGEDYKSLRKCYIIFICTFDPFKKGLYRYEFENRCIDAPEICLKDESTKIFLNPYGNGQKISAKLKDFLDYLVNRNCNSDFTKRLDEEVRAVVENEEWRIEYMTLKMRDRENIEKGFITGRKEGEILGRKEGITTGRAESVIDLLSDIGEVPEKIKEKIYAEKDLDVLKKWLYLAKRMDSLDEFQKNM